MIEYLKPRTIVFWQGKGFIEQGILACQDLYVIEKYGVKSQWSHVGLIADDGLYYDSTISFHGWNFKQGIRTADPLKLFTKKMLKDYNKLGFQFDLDLTDSDWFDITTDCQKAKHLKLNYGTMELFGTLFALLCWKYAKTNKARKKILKARNIFDSPEDVYCSAFVNDRIESCGRNYIDSESSISTVDELFFDSKIKNKTVEVKT